MYKKNIELAEGKDYGYETVEILGWRQRKRSERKSDYKAHRQTGIGILCSGVRRYDIYPYEYRIIRRSFKRSRKQLMRNLIYQLLEY